MNPLNYFTQQLVISVKPRAQSAPFFWEASYLLRDQQRYEKVCRKNHKKNKSREKKRKKRLLEEKEPPSLDEEMRE